jgi:hypothetical protein
MKTMLAQAFQKDVFEYAVGTCLGHLDPSSSIYPQFSQEHFHITALIHQSGIPGKAPSLEMMTSVLRSPYSARN